MLLTNINLFLPFDANIFQHKMCQIPSHHKTYLSAMTYTAALEYAHVVKSLVITSCTLPKGKTDRGNKTILERFIYINIIRELTQVIRHYGLFPNLSYFVHEPHLKLAYDYMSNKEEASAGKLVQFRKLLFSMGVTNINNHPSKTKCVTNELSRSIKADVTFNPNTCKQSLLPILILQIIYCLKSTCIEVNVPTKKTDEKKDATTPIKKKLKLPPGQNLVIAGSYEGISEGNNRHPFDTLYFTVNGKTKKVGRIGLLRLLGLSSNQSKNDGARSLRLTTLAPICFEPDPNIGKTKSSNLFENVLKWWMKEIKHDQNRTLLEIKLVDHVSSSKPANAKQSDPPDNCNNIDPSDSDENDSDDDKQHENQRKTKKKRKQDNNDNSTSTPATKKKKTLTEVEVNIPMMESVINMLQFVEEKSAFEKDDKLKWNNLVQNFAKSSLGGIKEMKKHANDPNISCSSIVEHCQSFLDRLNNVKSSNTSQLGGMTLSEKEEKYTYETIIDKLNKLQRTFPMAKIEVLPQKRVTNALVAINTAYTSTTDPNVPNIQDPKSLVKKKFIAFKVKDIPKLKKVMYGDNATNDKPAWMIALTEEMKRWTSGDNKWKISLSFFQWATRDITHVIVLDEEAYDRCFPMEENDENPPDDGEELDF